MQDQKTVARLHKVTKRYGAQTALDGLDLSLRPGELLALLGPNGAGKTTAISLLLGLQRPDAGGVSLFGMDPSRLDARRRLGVMLQETALQATLRVDELLELTSNYYPHPFPAGEVAALTGIEDLLPVRYGRLSGGQKRRVQFALAICGDPEILFLDEPTVGLDLEARMALWKTVRRLVDAGCSVVLTTHYLEEAEALADRVAVLVRGKLMAEGGVDAIRARVSQRRIRCVSALPADALRAWPEIARVESDGRHLHLFTEDAESLLRKLLASDPTLGELEVQRAGLAEAFVEITETVQQTAQQKEAA